MACICTVCMPGVSGTQGKIIRSPGTGGTEGFMSAGN